MLTPTSRKKMFAPYEVIKTHVRLIERRAHGGCRRLLADKLVPVSLFRMIFLESGCQMSNVWL